MVVGHHHSHPQYGYSGTSNFLPDYLTTYCSNFVMALPLQLIIVGPLARLIFRTIFRRAKN